jgi:hypothetical protein
MTSTTRSLLAILAGLAILFALSFAVFHWSAASGFPGSIMIDGHDLSDSPYAFLIAIPILFLVGLILTVVFASVALVVVFVLGFAALAAMTVLALAAAPFALILGIPALAIYGFIKLIERDRKAAAATA